MLLTLEGKTCKGQNKIREHGAEWRFVRAVQSAQCFDGAAGVLLQSTQDGDLRWIRKHNDPDFRVVECSEVW